MRAVIWTAVGLIVVAAIVIIISMRSQDNRVSRAALPTAAELQADAERFSKKADEYATEIQKLRQGLAARMTDAKKAKLARMDTLVAEIRAQAAKLPAQPVKKQIDAKRAIQDLQQEFADLRHELEK